MERYNVVETTNVSGKCFDFVYDEPIENGSLIAKGALAEGETNIYTARIPGVGDEVFLVADPAWSYETNKLSQNEDRYIVPAGKPFRAYGLLAANHDKFAVEDYGIAVNGTVKPGDYVGVDGTTVKITDLGTQEPGDGYGFVGVVTQKEPHGFALSVVNGEASSAPSDRVVIEVVRNSTVRS